MFILFRPRPWSLAHLAAAMLAAAGSLVQAQPAAAPVAEPTSLREAFAAAWQRHPDARAAPLRRDALQAQRRVAEAWTPEPAALEVAARSDRFTRNQGARELEVGVAVPLWLPGERQRAQALADGELAALDSRTAVAQWQLAGTLREAWWALQRARQDATSAQARHADAQALAGDVQRRVRAGDLARADQNQAEAAVATLAAEWAQARAQEGAAAQAWRALVGPALPLPAQLAAEPEPPAATSVPPDHPALRVWADRSEALRRALALGQVQRRGNPELTLLTTRDRGSAGEPTGQTVTLGLRVPLGSADRAQARTASLAADLAEAEAAWAAERDRLQADLDTARLRAGLAGEALQASERRAELARQTQGFVDKSYRAGETDLPTRLRVGAEAAEALRAAGRARIEQLLAISLWRQSLGLLPD